MSENLTVKYQYRAYTVRRLAKHFCMAVEDLKSEIEKQDDLIQFEQLEQYGCHQVFFVLHLKNLTLSNFLSPEKFLKSSVYAQFLEQEGKLHTNWKANFCMVIHVNGAVFALRRHDDTPVNATGIVTVTSEDEGFILMDFDHFLKLFYPNPSIENES